jgi:sulfonate transport system ATP-binding protein
MVRAVGVVKRFGERTVLAGASLEIARGEFVALLGSSGSGKSTLLRLMAGLDHPDRGGVDVPAARAVVFQDPCLLPWRRVWQNVVLGLPGATRVRSETALSEVRLQDRADDWPATLSGGEAQRVALARALVRKPELLLLDEPFASVDALTRIRMHELVLALWRVHRPAVLLVTHDIDEALQLADRVAVLRDGRIPVELRVPYERPRRRGASGLEALRDGLLAELGVVATEAA